MIEKVKGPKISRARVPLLSPALAIAALTLELLRDAHGVEACLAQGIGAMRRKVGDPGPPPPEYITDSERVRDQARVFLAALCAGCPIKDCPLHPIGP